MKINRCIAIIAAVFLIACSCMVTADILPREVPENQLFTLSSIIEAVGAVSESTSLVWQIGDAGITGLPPAAGAGPGDVGGSLANSIRSGSIGYVTYSDFIMTNGGQISEVKSFSMDTQEKRQGIYNIETAKVLTYTSQNGSHLMGEESYVLDVAGNWSFGGDDIICVFARTNNQAIPAFCNKVTASSKLNQVKTAQIETVGKLTAVGASAGVPAALQYEISVTPDANSASGYADGIFATTFTVSIMEGRSDGTIRNATSGLPVTGFPGARPVLVGDIVTLDNYAELASTLTYIDSASVVGGVSTFNKAFSYQSGINCDQCYL